MDERSQQPVSQHVAAVAQDEAFQWVGYFLKQCKHGAFSQNTLVMNRPRPSHDTVQDAGIGVADQLNVYRMIILSVHVFVLIDGCHSLDTCVQSTQPMTFGKFATT